MAWERARPIRLGQWRRAAGEGLPECVAEGGADGEVVQAEDARGKGLEPGDDRMKDKADVGEKRDAPEDGDARADHIEVPAVVVVVGRVADVDVNSALKGDGGE